MKDECGATEDSISKRVGAGYFAFDCLGGSQRNAWSGTNSALYEPFEPGDAYKMVNKHHK